MKPAEKVLRSWIRSLPTDARNVNIFNADGVLTGDDTSIVSFFLKPSDDADIQPEIRTALIETEECSFLQRHFSVQHVK
jgi:hypothetical protein